MTVGCRHRDGPDMCLECSDSNSFAPDTGFRCRNNKRWLRRGKLTLDCGVVSPTTRLRDLDILKALGSRGRSPPLWEGREWDPSDPCFGVTHPAVACDRQVGGGVGFPPLPSPATEGRPGQASF